MNPTNVSVIIPTIGRSTVRTAVESALRQTVPPHEVIVVADGGDDPDVPDSDIVTVLRTSGGEGPARARQLGVMNSTGNIIALLDDDDEWLNNKLEMQLANVPLTADWILSSRTSSRIPGGPDAVTPTKLITPHGSVAEYLFEFHTPRFGSAGLQTSTLMFPRTVADAVPLSVSADAVHDDPHWLLAVRRTLPDAPIVQLAEPLVQYGLTPDSLSRMKADRTDDYIRWGQAELAEETPRIRGDYLLTSPIAAALSAGSVAGVLRSVVAGVRCGRPGPWAMVYATAALGRVIFQRVRGFAGRMWKERGR